MITQIYNDQFIKHSFIHSLNEWMLIVQRQEIPCLSLPTTHNDSFDAKEANIFYV